MSITESNEKKWLIKSSGKILGPYSFDEVSSLLRERRLSLIDEVRSPDGRWLFIRECRSFLEIVKKMRDQQSDSREDTTSLSGTTKSITIDLTPPPVPQPLGRNPVPPNPLNPNASSTGNVKLSEILEGNSPLEKPTSATNYASARDPRIQSRASSLRNRTALFGWLLLLVVVLGLVVFQQMPKGEKDRSLGFNDLITLAKSSKALGQYEKSLEMFRKAEAKQKLDVSQNLQMVPLLMKVENQNVQARQILENMSVLNLETRSKAEVESLMALSYLREGRLDEAQKRYEWVSQNYPKHEPAGINLVAISLLQNDFETAVERLNEMFRSGMSEPILFLYRAISIFRNSNENSKLEAAKEDLKRLLDQQRDYRSESFLLLAAVETKLNHELDAKDAIKSLLETDPDLTRNHLHDLFVHEEVLEWGYLGNICEMLVKNGTDNVLFKGLGIYCTYQQGDLQAAISQMEQARTQFANDPTLAGLHSFLLWKSGRVNEAKALTQLPKIQETKLSDTVAATLCESQGNWACAEDTWRKLMQKDSKNISAFAGLARVALHKGQPEMAQDFIKQGLLISNHYKPLVELKGRINDR